jgi:peptidoglycan/xylan/chitin deacetylase (PgdA/CDA1 family)
MARWKFRIDAETASTAAVYFDASYRVKGRARGKVILSFDDGAVSQYDNARPILNTLGLKADFNLVYNILNTTGFFTDEQVATLKADGHAILPHGQNALTTLTIEEARADVLANIAYVSGHDPRGAKHYVYPNGLFEYSSTDTQIIDMLKSVGIVTGRTTSRFPSSNSTIKGLQTPHTLAISGYNAASGDNVTTMKASIDRAYRTGATVFLMFHKVVASPSVDIDISTANFTEIMNHLALRKAEGRVDVVTTPDWYAGLSHGRMPRT